jgi:CHAD domain-containing protein
MAKAWEVAGIEESTSLGESAKLIITTKFREAFSFSEVVTTSEDIEVVHDMRVSLRRLWAAMTSFAHYFEDSKKFIKLSKHTRKLARKLGAVRDLDVLIEILQKQSQELVYNPSALFAIDYIVSHCYTERIQHRAKLFKYLEKLVQRSFETKFLEFFETIEITNNSSKKERKIFLNSLENFYEHDAKGSAESEALHQLRIAAKKLRYSLEFFEVCFQQPLTEQLKSLRQLQELLGDLHDCDVMVSLLKSYRPNKKIKLEIDLEIDLGLKELITYFKNKRANFLELFQNLWLQEFEVNFYNQLKPLLHSQINDV